MVGGKLEEEAGHHSAVLAAECSSRRSSLRRLWLLLVSDMLRFGTDLDRGVYKAIEDAADRNVTI
ncbi:hypothetical protein ACJRO7_015327, partial [Eucalyptus globulus]